MGRHQPGKMANLEVYEITALCRRSREVFLSQPMLLELVAPINICGRLICDISADLFVIPICEAC